MNHEATAPTTCADALRQGRLPVCEWNPEEGRLALLGDRFHALALFVMGPSREDGERLRVCPDCLRRIKDRGAQGRIVPR